MYFRGEGVPEDSVQAFAWWNLAATAGHENASKNKEIARSRMSVRQIAEAQTLSRELAKTTPMEWQGSTDVAQSQPPNSSSELVRDVQMELATLGFSPGPADGLADAKTVSAVRAYQRSRELPETGLISAELLMLLRSRQ